MTFLSSSLLGFGVVFRGQHLLGVCYILEAAHVLATRFHDAAQVFVFFRELDVALLVADYVRVGNQCADLFVACHEAVQLVE